MILIFLCLTYHVSVNILLLLTFLLRILKIYTKINIKE